jgi:alpha-1,2-mannosyltransferase
MTATNKGLMARRDWPLGPTIGWMLTVALLVLQWGYLDGGIWVDSDVYILGARTMLEGGDLYAVTTSAKLPFTYAPFAAVVFIPLALLPVAAGRVALTLLSLACYAGVTYLIGRWLDLPLWRVALVGSLGLALEPMLRNLLLGQVNLILMALVVVDCLLVPHRWRGLLVGLAAGIKIIPGVFAVYFLLKRDWPSAARSGLAFLGTLAIGWLAAPKATAEYWSGGFLGLEKFGGAAVMGADNQSLLGVWMRLTADDTVPSVLKVLFVLIGMSLGIGGAYICLRQSLAHPDVRALACLALGALLGSPVSWSHHWVWIVVVLLVLASQQRWLAIVLTVLVMFLAPFWGLYEDNGFRLPRSAAEHLLGGLYVALGPILIGLVATPRVARPRPGSGPVGNSGRETLIQAGDHEQFVHEPPLTDQ